MQSTPPSRKRLLSRRWLLVGLLLAGICLLLWIPEREPVAPAGAGKTPFVWNQDPFWSELERQFVNARSNGCGQTTERMQKEFAEAETQLAPLRDAALAPDAKEFSQLEATLFQLAPLVAACPERLNDYVALATRTRSLVKNQSRQWSFASVDTRVRLYRLLFGLRMAVEEVLLQSPTNQTIAGLTLADEEPSQTPAFRPIEGIALHSGDILLSRGGAPTSALIARGNDYPGSFSHAALLYVDEATREPVVIEAHIERGVAVSSLKEYLADKKLRIMVLRLRADLPAMKTDPMLPHKAATAALRDVEKRHIPYDFAMDWRDPRKQFCSEVASAPYAELGIHLWTGPSYLSSPVLTAWLASVGVKHFETQEPSDLEYDPQLVVVAEWRDRETLLKAHIDDAVIDVMLENGRPGEGLPYDRSLLPVARLSKGVSVVLNWCGRIGPVPEGLSATEALRVKRFRSEHEAVAQKTLELAGQFEKEKGYAPFYWELVELARKARGKL